MLAPLWDKFDCRRAGLPYNSNPICRRAGLPCNSKRLTIGNYLRLKSRGDKSSPAIRSQFQRRQRSPALLPCNSKPIAWPGCRAGRSRSLQTIARRSVGGRGRPPRFRGTAPPNRKPIAADQAGIQDIQFSRNGGPGLGHSLGPYWFRDSGIADENAVSGSSGCMPLKVLVRKLRIDVTG